MVHIPTDDQYRSFLLSIVNGEDQSTFSGKRSLFRGSYYTWLPLSSIKTFTEADYRNELGWWDPKWRDTPLEQPHPEFGFHVAVLRFKLRVIWTACNLKEWESAERKVGYLITDTHRYLRDFNQSTQDPWRYHVRGSCKWLEKNITRLKICKRSSCMSPFFVREAKNQQYCCAACAAEGQRLAWKSRSRGTKKISPQGSAAISEAVRLRWEKYRAAKIRIDE